MRPSGRDRQSSDGQEHTLCVYPWEVTGRQAGHICNDRGQNTGSLWRPFSGNGEENLQRARKFCVNLGAAQVYIPKIHAYSRFFSLFQILAKCQTTKFNQK